jgi:hypothetical protein
LHCKRWVIFSTRRNLVATQHPIRSHHSLASVYKYRPWPLHELSIVYNAFGKLRTLRIGFVDLACAFDSLCQFATWQYHLVQQLPVPSIRRRGNQRYIPRHRAWTTAEPFQAIPPYFQWHWQLSQSFHTAEPHVHSGCSAALCTAVRNQLPSSCRLRGKYYALVRHWTNCLIGQYLRCVFFSI